jgi:hypothetical protein
MDRIVVRKENNELNVALYQKNNNDTFCKVTELKGNGNSVELAIENFNILIYPHSSCSNSNKENRIEIIRKEMRKIEEEIKELENSYYDSNEKDEEIRYKEKFLEYLKEKEAENSEEIVIDYLHEESALNITHGNKQIKIAIKE